MSTKMILKRQFRVSKAPHHRPVIECSAGSVPRISRLMALAIHFDQLIRDGDVADQAELAHLGHVSRARVTQIMNLLNLAPDVQEDILYLSSGGTARDAISERHLRPIAANSNWCTQRQAWRAWAYRAGRKSPFQLALPSHGHSVCDMRFGSLIPK
jgi:hypothetical protein